MTWDLNPRQSGNSSQTSTQTGASDSQTPAARSLLLVGYGSQNDLHTATSAAQAPVSSGGDTFTKIAESGTYNWNGAANRALHGSLWYTQIGDAPSGFGMTVDNYAGTDLGYYTTKSGDVLGYDTGSPLLQSKATGAVGNGTNVVAGSLTLDAAPHQDNLLVLWVMAGADGGGALGVPSAGATKTLTQLSNEWNNPVQSAMFYRVCDGDESATITLPSMGNTVGNWVAIAAEFKAAPPIIFTVSRTMRG